MDGRGWSFSLFRLRMATLMAAALLCHSYLSLRCWCLNDEGMALLRFRESIELDPFDTLSNWIDGGGELDHCSWFGVECSHGVVVTLNLQDLCLQGTPGPYLGKLSHAKSIILRNNSFFGNIPQEICEMKRLKLLDLGYNNFAGPLPCAFGNNPSLPVLLLDNNEFLQDMRPLSYELKLLSDINVHQKQLFGAEACNRKTIIWYTSHAGDIAERRQLQVMAESIDNEMNTQSSSSPSSSSLTPSEQVASTVLAAHTPLSFISIPPLTSASSEPDTPFSSPVESPNGNLYRPSASPILSPSPASPAPSNSPTVVSEPPASHSAPSSSPDSISGKMVGRSSKSQHHTVTILGGIIASFVLLSLSVIGLIFCRSNKVVTVKPWTTGLSGQLQKAFITGVPSLKLSEVKTACEDFSNIIGYLSDGIVYKGTLSSGVEIAVISSANVSSKDWSKESEVQFREKIHLLSRVNHKNFLNLIGFCEEDKPFKRMMVFEYAPNGTLSEHLHFEEAEHLDWSMRLRIAMGIAYCLDYMHRVSPPIVHGNLQSSCVYLTDDYAAKISEFSFWDKIDAAQMGSATVKISETSPEAPESDVYSFGVILLETITGRSAPRYGNYNSLIACAPDHLKRELSSKEMVDASFKSYKEDELERLVEVIKLCVHPEPKLRPTMREVTAMLKEITEMGPDGATPKSSPLWWAELEISSTEES